MIDDDMDLANKTECQHLSCEYKTIQVDDLGEEKTYEVCLNCGEVFYDE